MVLNDIVFESGISLKNNEKNFLGILISTRLSSSVSLVPKV
jgi:hypothetical protein